ncbi:MAG: putative lipid II flippase FtsW [Candidatus Omnitrophica bacterium]|nr:putative lipid II flippase FtsW [Candidatus Omnitrophota bacterium]
MKQDARIVFTTMFILLMTGVVMIYSSSAVYAYGQYGDSFFFVKKHLLYLLLGSILAVCCMAVHPRRIRSAARWIMAAALGLLVMVLIPGIGSQISGARRWIRIIGLGFQPSEVAKFALIIYMADFTARKRYQIGDLKRGFLPALSVVGLTGALILMEPDMGTSVAILFVGMIMLFVSGADLRHLGAITFGMLPVLILAVISEPYRMRRILAFCDPWKDARGAGFQLIQSFIALGSGGVLGVGLGASKQKLFYLPESHTDFIFSIVGEELGFLGTSSVLILFAVMIWFSLRIALRTKELFASRVVLGIAVLISFEVIVNIGVSTGAFPTKGLPLPFISYGGSSLVCHLGAMGLLFNMARYEE